MPSLMFLIVTEFLVQNVSLRSPIRLTVPTWLHVTFLLNPTAKKDLKGQRFDNENEAGKALEVFLKRMSRIYCFLRVFQGWKTRWGKCIALEGKYFGGDKSVCLFYLTKLWLMHRFAARWSYW